MNSLKNTVVIALLLGVSYGVFQLMNTPPANIADEQEPVELEILDDDSEPDDGAAAFDPQMQTQPPPLMNGGQSNPGGNGISKTNSSFPAGMVGSQTETGQPDTQFPRLPDNDLDLGPRANAINDGPLDRVPPLNPQTGGSFANSDRMVPVQSNPGLPQANSTGINLLGGGAGGDDRGPAEPMTAAPRSAAELDGAFLQATRFVNEGNLVAALRLLSGFYRSRLAPEQRAELLMWLDSLAGKVIYSQNHQLTGQPYVIRQGDTLDTISTRWNVPPRLVYKINESTLNAIGELRPGTQLKQVPGPFHAEVNLGRQEMTLFLDGLYAGRFPLDFGGDQPIREGTYVVLSKSEQGKSYQDKNGQDLNPQAASNPYGKFWLDLGGGLCIHSRATQDNRGCIRVGQNDAVDVFGILSRNSEVKIVR